MVTTPVHEDRSIPAKAMLKRDGFTIFDIVHASGTSQGTVSNVLAGNSHNAKVMAAISAVYPKLTKTYLFGADS